MATIVVNVVPGPNGPIYQVVGASTGHTLQINDFMHPDTAPGSVVADSLGRRGKQSSAAV